MSSAPRLILRRRLKRALAGGHPWIYRDALEGPTSAPGTVVTVVDERGRFVARGLAEAGAIGVRVLTVEDEPVDDALLLRRVEQAAALRRQVVPEQTDAYRLVHGEGDRLPGLVCDVYGGFASIALDGAAAVALRARWLAALRPVLEQLGVRGALVRHGHRHARTVEPAFGTPPPEELVVREHGMALVVDLAAGQKTGLFLDHRPARRRVRELAADRRVLDLYAYVGGFSAAAGLGGATAVTTVDIAAPALAMAARTWAANGLPEGGQTRVAADVPHVLGELAAKRARFDLIVADPPSFAPNAAAVHKALRAYEKLHVASLELLTEGGWLLAASCSSHVDAASFREVLAGAAAKAGRVVQIVDGWGAPPDHPRLAAFPEGDYLCVLLARAL